MLISLNLLAKCNGDSVKYFDHTLHVCDERDWRRQGFNQGYTLRNCRHSPTKNKCSLYLIQ